MMNKILLKTKKIFNRAFSKDLDYKNYWNNEYVTGAGSGPGSYGKPAEFKAEVINGFLKENEITSVIEFGCGDGNQLSMISYPDYLGLDVARASVELCTERFKDNAARSFMWYDPGAFVNPSLFLKADLVVCLDVLYHIIDDNDFLRTLDAIFSCASRHVILYTTTDIHEKKDYEYMKGSHGKHRDTMHYLSQFSDFEIVKTIPQRHPDLSSASFIILTKK